MKILSWLFSFGDKYFELQERYEISRYPFFRFLMFVITASLPTLIFWGAMEIGFGEAWLATILLIAIALLLWVKTPKELFILSLVAIVHGAWAVADRKSKKAKAQEKVGLDTNYLDDDAQHIESDAEYLETGKKKKRRAVKWQNSDSNPAWDFIIGVLGMVLAIASLVGPFVYTYLIMR